MTGNRYAMFILYLSMTHCFNAVTTDIRMQEPSDEAGATQPYKSFFEQVPFEWLKGNKLQ